MTRKKSTRNSKKNDDVVENDATANENVKIPIFVKISRRSWATTYRNIRECSFWGH